MRDKVIKGLAIGLVVVMVVGAFVFISINADDASAQSLPKNRKNLENLNTESNRERVKRYDTAANKREAERINRERPTDFSDINKLSDNLHSDDRAVWQAAVQELRKSPEGVRRLHLMIEMLDDPDKEAYLNAVLKSLLAQDNKTEAVTDNTPNSGDVETTGSGILTGTRSDTDSAGAAAELIVDTDSTADTASSTSSGTYAGAVETPKVDNDSMTSLTTMIDGERISYERFSGGGVIFKRGSGEKAIRYTAASWSEFTEMNPEIVSEFGISELGLRDVDFQLELTVDEHGNATDESDDSEDSKDPEESRSYTKASVFILDTIEDGSAAETLGLKLGDMVIAINRKPILDIANIETGLKKLMQQNEENKTITFIRNGELFIMPIK